MSVETTPSVEETAVPAPRPRRPRLSQSQVFMLSITGLALFLVWLARLNFFAPPPENEMPPEHRANRERIKSMIRYTGGDINKLKKEDLAWLKQLAGPYYMYPWQEVQENWNR